MMRFVLLVVVVSVFVSGGSVDAQSRSMQSPAVELSEWDTSTLLRLRDLLEAEIARRDAAGDLTALQAVRTVGVAGRTARRRSQLRTWSGVGMMAGGVAIVRHVNDRRSEFLRFGQQRYPYVGAWTATGVGVVALGTLLATRWADVPVAASAEFGGGRAAVGAALAW